MARRHTTSSLTRKTEREETGGKKEGKEAGKKEKRGSGAVAGRARGKCRDVLSREPVRLVLSCPGVRLWPLGSTQPRHLPVA